MIASFLKSWNNYLDTFCTNKRDIYFREEYVKLCVKTKNETALSLVISEGNNYMIFPFIERFFIHKDSVYKDFETAYGYGGPIFNTDNTNFIREANSLMFETFKKNDYICGFVRFHPLLNNERYFQIGNVLEDRRTVGMDISLKEEDIWMKEIHTKNRNIIKKGEKNGLKFYADYKFTYLDDFINLYNQTMNKLSADDFYYFDAHYYKTFIKKIRGCFLGVVFLEDKILSAAIFMYEGIYAHYHLSGSDRNYLSYLPNNFMLYQAALELKKHGVKIFHLGGGTTSNERDSLFCFKEKFSKHFYQFSIGKVIFNKEIYNKVCNEWEITNPDKIEKYMKFLLKYKY